MFHAFALLCTLAIFSADPRFHAYAEQKNPNVNEVPSSSEATIVRASISSILVQRDVCDNGGNCSTIRDSSTSVDQPSTSYTSIDSNNTFIFSSPLALTPATSLALPDGPPQPGSTSSSTTAEPGTAAPAVLHSATSIALPSYPTLTLESTATDGISDVGHDSPTSTAPPVASVFSVLISAASQETAQVSAISEGGTQPQTESAASAMVIGSQTLSPGSTITADGHVFAIPTSMTSGVVVDDSTTIFPDLSELTGAAAYVITAAATATTTGEQGAGVVYSPLSSGASGLVVESQTLLPGSVITAGGATISLPTGSSISGIVIASGGVTQTREFLTGTTTGTGGGDGDTSSSSSLGSGSGTRSSGGGLTTTTASSTTSVDGGEATESATTGQAARSMFEVWVMVFCFLVATGIALQ